MIRLQRLALLAGVSGLLAAPALADDLREALVMAYGTNPTLQSARAQQRATDEGVPIARSAGLPSARSGASYTEFVDKTASSPLLPSRNFSAGVDLGMPVYAGGGIKNSIRAAETRVDAGRADLRAVVGEVADERDVIRVRTNFRKGSSRLTEPLRPPLSSVLSRISGRPGCPLPASCRTPRCWRWTRARMI